MRDMVHSPDAMSPVLMELETAAERLLPIEALRQFVDILFKLDVSELEDDNFAVIETLIDRAIRLLAESTGAEQRELIARLLVAREGIEQGLPADPDKRPTVAEMRKFVSAHLS